MMTEPGLRRMAWVLIVGAVAPLLDTTVVNVAVDQLGREMDASVSAVQWVITGYLLALSMAVPLSGWAARRWARGGSGSRRSRCSSPGRWPRGWRGTSGA